MAELESFSSALTTWKDINLSVLQKTLDASGLEIVENQKENQIGRKKLAEQTRDFKKISDEEKLGAFKGLLKAYQTEIDALTKRSKVAESAFLNVYKLLAEAPDPYPLLDAAVDHTVRASEARLLESELSRSKDEVAQLKKELVEAKEVEKDRKKQQDRADKLETKLEDMVKTRVANKESELNATYAERIANFQDRERDLTKQVEVARTQLRDLRTSNESTQARLLDDSSKRDFESATRHAEMEMAQQDLERAHRRVEEVERRNEKLRAEIEAVRSGSESQEKVKALEAQIEELHSETSRMLNTLEAQKDAATRERQERERREEEVKRHAATTEAEIKLLRSKVQQYSDYDEVKRELEIMKFVEFTSMNLDDDEDYFGSDEVSTLSSGPLVRMPDPNANKSLRSGGGKSLETLLVSKNRKLQDDVTTLRVAYDELAATARLASGEKKRFEDEAARLKALNEKLEEDLTRIRPGGGANGIVNGLGGDSRSANASGTVTPRNDPLSGLNLGAGRRELPEAGPSAVSSPSIKQGPPSSAETSILPIITSQRDRFRQRNAELEEELRKQFEAITETRNEMKALQADNLKLYEKVRYLQSYREDGSSAGVGGAGGAPGVHSAVARKDEELAKYRGIYEDQMDPFGKFRGRERFGAMQALNPLDRLVFHAANFILGRRTARTLFLLYAVGIHALLFMTISGSAMDADAFRHAGNEAIPPMAAAQIAGGT